MERPSPQWTETSRMVSWVTTSAVAARLHVPNLVLEEWELEVMVEEADTFQVH